MRCRRERGTPGGEARGTVVVKRCVRLGAAGNATFPPSIRGAEGNVNVRKFETFPVLLLSSAVKERFKTPKGKPNKRAFV